MVKTLHVKMTSFNLEIHRCSRSNVVNTHSYVVLYMFELFSFAQCDVSCKFRKPFTTITHYITRYRTRPIEYCMHRIMSEALWLLRSQKIVLVNILCV